MTKNEETTQSRDTAKAAQLYEALRRTRPRTKEDLRNYVKVFLGVEVPDLRICPEHSSPMDYLWHSFAGDSPQFLIIQGAVAGEIEKRILEGSLKPGDRLPSERDLATMLGVSRPSLREARWRQTRP